MKWASYFLAAMAAAIIVAFAYDRVDGSVPVYQPPDQALARLQQLPLPQELTDKVAEGNYVIARENDGFRVRLRFLRDGRELSVIEARLRSDYVGGSRLLYSVLPGRDQPVSIEDKIIASPFLTLGARALLQAQAEAELAGTHFDEAAAARTLNAIYAAHPVLLNSYHRLVEADFVATDHAANARARSKREHCFQAAGDDNMAPQEASERCS